MQLVTGVTLPPVAAQGSVQNLIPEAEVATLHAKITGIDANSRTVTLRGLSGEQVAVTADPLVRLDMLKVGDTVNAKSYRSVAFAVTPTNAHNWLRVLIGVDGGVPNVGCAIRNWGAATRSTRYFVPSRRFRASCVQAEARRGSASLKSSDRQQISFGSSAGG